MNPQPRSHVRTALFVDFDNVYSNLCEIDPAAGEAFATEPQRWLRWMQEDMGQVVPDAPDGMRREILVRSCYLNPVMFSRFRPYFTRSAFRVVDCPPLTSRGKNSADIYMVLDIVDTLAHSTYFDEFIVLSADADFTPVMLRLRAHDRRTVLLASGPSAAALQSACDMVLPADVFLTEALQISGDRPAGPPGRSGPDRFPRGATMGGWPARWAAPGPAGGLTAAGSGPASGGAASGGSASGGSAPGGSGPDGSAPDGGVPADGSASGAGAGPTGIFGTRSTPGFRERMRRELAEIVAVADSPVPMAAAAQQLRDRLGPEVGASNWGGYGSFGRFAESAASDTLQVSGPRPPGYLIDPRRHEQLLVEEPRVPLPAEIAQLAARVGRIAGVPQLTPEAYRILFEELARLSADGDITGSQTEVEQRVRDACKDRGARVARPAVHFVLQGFYFAGVNWRAAGRQGHQLAEAFAENVLRLCLNARMELTDEEKAQLHRWIAGDGQQ